MVKSQENKKIKNAQETIYDGIIFKSKLEVMCYKALKEANLPVQYESKKFILWEGFKPTVPFYDKDKKTKLLKLQTKKLLNTTYSPDFYFEYGGHNIIIESKGFENEAFHLKKKLFRAWLEANQPNSIYFEIYTKKQLMQAIDIIKQLKSEENGKSFQQVQE